MILYFYVMLLGVRVPTTVSRILQRVRGTRQISTIEVLTKKPQQIIHADFRCSSKYKPAAPQAASVPRDGDWHYQFSTQFESCDARRAFPCFDEPNLKATFDFKVEIPEDQVALSNMPQKSIEKSAKPGFHTVSFDKTPIMSTYLLAWAIGDFEHIEAFTERKYNGKPLPVRLYTTRGLAKQGQFALEHAPKIIDYFSEIFDIDYPLPKSDILAVHEFVRIMLHLFPARYPRASCC